MPTKLIRKQFLLSVDENNRLEGEALRRGMSVSNLTRTLHGLEPLKAGGVRKQKLQQRKKGVEPK